MGHPSYDVFFHNAEARERSDRSVREMARRQLLSQLRAAEKVPATIRFPDSLQGQMQLEDVWRRIDTLREKLGLARED